MDPELDILNAMLSAIGTSQISSRVGRHPGLIRAQPILDRTNRSVQAVGHWFNTDWGLTLSPDASGEIVLPQSTLKADTTNKRLPYVRRGRRLYDPKENTYEIGEPVDMDVVILLDYEDLPVTAVDLIRTIAIWEIVQDEDMDGLALQSRRASMQRAERAFGIEKMSQSDRSLRDNPEYSRIISSVIHGRRSTNPLYIGG